MWRQLKARKLSRLTYQLLVKKKNILPQCACMSMFKEKDSERREGSQYNFNTSFAMLDIFSYLDEHEQALKVLEHHRLSGHELGIRFYNKLLQLLVSAHRYDEFQNVLFLMTMEEVEPDVQTFATRLEAYGNMADSGDDVLETLKEMKSHGLDYNSLFTQVPLLEKQIKSIKEAYRSVNLSHVADAGPGPSSPLRDLKQCDQRVQQQIENELQGVVYVEPVVVNKQSGSTLKLKHKRFYDDIIGSWKKAFLKKLAETDSASLIASKSALYDKCLALVKVIPPNELCDMVFDHIVPQIAAQPRGVPILVVAEQLGELMHKSFRVKFLKKNSAHLKAANVAHDYLIDETDANPRLRWSELCKKYNHFEDIEPSYWTRTVKILISSVPIHILKATAVIDTREAPFNQEKGGVVSALAHGYIKEDFDNWKMRKGVLTFHSLICRLYAANLACGGKLAFDADDLPLVSRPRPWSSRTKGGYLLTRTQLLRGTFGSNEYADAGGGGGRDSVLDVGENLADCDGDDDDDTDTDNDVVDDDDDIDDEDEVDDASVDDVDALGQIYDSMNILGDCRWIISTRLLDVMIEVMRSGGDLQLDIVGSNAMDEVEQEVRKSAKLGRVPRYKAKKKYREIYALYIDSLMKLSLPNYFRNNIIYNSHSIDFRGRAYPLAPHCSHTSGDVSRSMLVFADGKKLGQRGLDWLKVHLVNVHGQLKKASLEERITYADNLLDDIMDSADKPLTGRQWWKGGEDPWQTLMACFEITDAVRSGDPENFVSHLPVQMDGSCNGLQHYAALGRDFHGAVQVNLVPSERPQDVYSEVRALVETMRQSDEDAGNELARALRGCITRKVVKQTVMTTVYGVTRYGARLQVLRQIEDQGILDPSIQNKAAAYITQQIFASLELMLPSAKKIQDWLTASARQIASAGKIVEWVTPLGLLAKQSYYRGNHKEQVYTPFFSVNIIRKDDFLVPDLRKQQGGFAPNYVHSLDATHMMYTSLRCKEQGIEFASVHDSFWTHGCDVDVLHQVCREEFIKLHEQPLLDNLKTYFDSNFAGLKLRKEIGGNREVCFDELPERGELDIHQVLESKYFFS